MLNFVPTNLSICHRTCTVQFMFFSQMHCINLLLLYMNYAIDNYHGTYRITRGFMQSM